MSSVPICSPHGWFPEIFGVKYLLNILIVAIVCIAMHIYLRYSKHGYEIAVVGPKAKYRPLHRHRCQKGHHPHHGSFRRHLWPGRSAAGRRLSHSIDSSLVDGRGFTAIMVSWLAKFDPFTMILTTLLLVFWPTRRR